MGESFPRKRGPSIPETRKEVEIDEYQYTLESIENKGSTL
jgi:hypothetical protein